jgi:hypothetical protein
MQASENKTTTKLPWQISLGSTINNPLTLRLYCVSGQLSQKFKLLVARSQTYIKTITTLIQFNSLWNNNNQTLFQPGASANNLLTLIQFTCYSSFYRLITISD